MPDTWVWSPDWEDPLEKGRATQSSIQVLEIPWATVHGVTKHRTLLRDYHLTRWTFVGKVMSLLFDTLSRFVIAFLPRSEHLLISWLQSPSAVILKLKQIKSVTVSIISPSVSQEVIVLDAMIFVFWMLSFKPAFHSPLSPSSRSSLVPLCLNCSTNIMKI